MSWCKLHKCRLNIMINVVLADDHVLVRDGIKALLEDQSGIEVIDEASNGKEALEVISQSLSKCAMLQHRYFSYIKRYAVPNLHKLSN